MTFKAVYFPGDPLRKTEIQNAEFELNSLRDQGYTLHCCCPMATSTLIIMSRDNPLPVQEVAISVDTQATKPSTIPVPSPEETKPHPEHPEHPQHPEHPEHPQHPAHPEPPTVPPFTPNIVVPPPVVVQPPINHPVHPEHPGQPGRK